MKPLILSTIALELARLYAGQAAGGVEPLRHSAEAVTASIKTAVGRMAVKQQPFENVVPEFIIGGEWTTTLKLTNRGTASIPQGQGRAIFVDSDGRSMTATFQITGGSVITDSGFTFFLEPGAIVETTFFGTSQTQFGHILIDPSTCPATAACGLYGEAVLRNRNATRPDFESVFPLEQPADVQHMLFDHRSGNSTILYLVGLSSGAETVALEFRNASNQLVRTVSVTLPSAGSQIIPLTTAAPETIGLMGTLTIRVLTANAYVTATALKINPSNSFTPVRAFVPK